VIGRYSTDAVEGGHERRSGAAAEHQDERSGRSVEVFEQTSSRARDAVRRQLDYVGVMRGGAQAHRGQTLLGPSLANTAPSTTAEQDL